MADFSGIGKFLIGLGVLLAAIGLLLTILPRLPGLGEGFGWLGKLPGDILIKRDSFTFYFPLGTSLLISVVLSLLFYILSRW